MTHLASVLVLLLKIHTIKSCAGMYDLSRAFFYDDFWMSWFSFLGGLSASVLWVVVNFCIDWYGMLD